MSKPQVMTLKEAISQRLITSPAHNVISVDARRALRAAGSPNAKGMVTVTTKPDALDKGESRTFKLGASSRVTVYEVVVIPTAVEAAPALASANDAAVAADAAPQPA